VPLVGRPRVGGTRSPGPAQSWPEPFSYLRTRMDHTYGIPDDVNAPEIKSNPTYGAAHGPRNALPVKRVPRPNKAAAAVTVLVPTFIFAVVTWARAFEIRVKQPGVSESIVFLCLALVGICACLAYTQYQRKLSAEPGYEPMWYMFLYGSAFLSFFVGLWFGEYNWNAYVEPYNEYAYLNQYSDVNPAEMRGSQMMDAGIVRFVEGSYLDISKSIGFNNEKMYCVTPISFGKDEPQSYDFWAVGTNCCAGMASSFKCGDWSDSRTRQGLRMMKESERSFYRLAVQKAEQTYQLEANHPLFFTWTLDGPHTVKEMYAQAVSNLILGIFGYIALQGALASFYLISCAKQFADQK